MGEVKLYVPIGSDARERLDEMARAERRHPSAQAALLLERALRRGGRVVQLRPAPLAIDHSPAVTA